MYAKEDLLRKYIARCVPIERLICGIIHNSCKNGREFLKIFNKRTVPVIDVDHVVQFWKKRFGREDDDSPHKWYDEFASMFETMDTRGRLLLNKPYEHTIMSLFPFHLKKRAEPLIALKNKILNLRHRRRHTKIRSPSGAPAPSDAPAPMRSGRTDAEDDDAAACR